MDRLLKLTFLALGAICLSLYGYLFWDNRITRSPGPADTPPSPGQESVDLWDAYERAQAAARQTGRDAQPVSASTQWQSATEDVLLTGASQWSFGFYAPSDNQALDVVVTRESARVADQSRVWDAPATLSEGAWREGPRDPLLVFLARGGREFLEEHRQAVVSMHLANSEEEGPLWDVAAVTMGDRSLLAVRIDAETLEVLSTTIEDGEG
jgi:hypothetical protein